MMTACAFSFAGRACVGTLVHSPIDPIAARPSPTMRFSPTWLARRLALLAGALDFGSGLGLVALPAAMLPLMGLPVPGEEALTFVRFVGAFVAAVGACYLWALRRPGERLRVVLGATLWFRLAAGSYVLGAVLRGSLDASWLTVTAADYGLIVAQLWLLARGAERETSPEGSQNFATHTDVS